MIDWIGDLLPYLDGIVDGALGLIFSLLAALIFYIVRLRPKLIYGRPHSSRHVLNLAGQDEPVDQLEIYNEQFFVSNEGRRAAASVEIVLSHFPRNIAINPPCDWSVKNVENGHCQILVPYIAAHELITVDCIYLNQRAAFIASVRCEESVGKSVNFWTVRRLPDWVNRVVILLLILGVAYVLQFVIELTILN